MTNAKLTNNQPKVKVQPRCTTCGRLQKRTAHLYNNMCPRCYKAYLVGKTELVGGRSGVTNTQLLMAISVNIDDAEVLNGLKTNYPNMFVNAIRYLKVSEQAKITEIFGDLTTISARQLELINLIKPGRSGVSGSKLLPVLEDALQHQRFEQVDALLEFYPELVKNQARYLHAPYRRLLEAYQNQTIGARGVVAEA